jgi:nucleotide-binding universal stress UspA family protein
VFETGPGAAALPSAARLRELADRHTGIGFDQALAIEPPRVAGTAAFYRIFHAAGGEVEQCGNGARAVAELLRRTARPLLVVRQIPHEPYQRVLVALDFSPWSAQAIAVARQVAPQARLLLFNAFQVPFEEKLHFAGVDPGTVEGYRQQARAHATQRVHAMAADSGLQSGAWEPCIVEGDASQRILEAEQNKHIDLVVLGKHGQSATEDLLLGSVSKHVLAEGSSDVLVSTARSA